MKNQCSLSSSTRIAMMLCGLLLVSSSCRKESIGETETEEDVDVVVPVVAPELHSNGIAEFPGVVYKSQSTSPIHWQPWTKLSFERAKDAQRLVFCVVALPQQPAFLEVLDALVNDRSVVKSINESYVPILLDGDAAREMGLLTAQLCSEIKRGVQLPLFLWMTHEANPVAWIPADSTNSRSIVEGFSGADSMVRQTWEDDGEYVIKNSAKDNLRRRKRMEERRKADLASEEPAEDVVRGIRQLCSLYDPASGGFDGGGGLVPAGALELLATAAIHPGLPPAIRSRCLTVTRELTRNLLTSAMFDPLDEGVFQFRRGNSWALPLFVRDCPGQARIAVSLLQAYRATGDELTREKALGLIRFAERRYRTSDGLFATGVGSSNELEKWMWSVEDIEKALSPEDAEWWIKVTGMRGLGNLPSEIDPRREFFRKNTLALSKSVAEIAADLSQSEEEFVPRFEAVRKKLLEIRSQRLRRRPEDKTPHAGASFQMVSTYAAAYGVTGDESYREKAIALLKLSREAFGSGPELRVFRKEAPASISAGRAFVYALAMQAALDVASITLDGQWLDWSEELGATAAKIFVGEGVVKECPDEANVVNLPFTEFQMMFGDSTTGLLSMAECRFSGHDRALAESLGELVVPISKTSMARPIVYTDALQATLARYFGVDVLIGKNVAPELKDAVERLQMRVIQRRMAKADEQVPDGAVKVVFPEGEGRVASSVAELREAVLPLSGK